MPPLALARALRVGQRSGLTGLYGSQIVMDALTNYRCGKTWHERSATVFIAPVSSTLASVRWYKRAGTATYSGGTGGDIRVSIQSVDGAGKPSGSILASVTHAAIGNSTNRGYLSTFSSPASLTAGTKYAIVYDNVDVAPGTNYVSVNYGTIIAPLPDVHMPRFPINADCMVWLDQGGGNSWEDPFGSVAYPLLPIFDATFGDGSHFGVGYTLADVSAVASITDAAWVRQSMTIPAGTARRVSDAYIRIRRTSGTDPLTVQLVASDSTVVAATTVAAASIAIGADPAATASTWAHAVFPSPVFLEPGSLYYLVLKGSATTTYTAVPLWKGSTDSYSSATFFGDGKAQRTTNSGGTWADFAVNTGLTDLQFYLRGS